MIYHYMITEAYLDCMGWADCNEDNDPAFNDASFSKKLKDQAEDDCRNFIVAISDAGLDVDGLTWADIGYDFYLTRNNHGAGFWDRGLGELGDKLTAIAKSFGEIYPYVGNDGFIYTE